MAGLTNLQYLNLINTQVSREQFENLQKALPNCDILEELGQQIESLPERIESKIERLVCKSLNISDDLLASLNKATL